MRHAPCRCPRRTHGFSQAAVGARMSRSRDASDGSEASATLVRGVVAERVIISTPLDPFLGLRALAGYSGLSVRTLRTYLDLPPREALPCYRVGGKILVRRSEFDGWVAGFRRRGRPAIDEIVSDVLRDLGGAG